MNKVILEQRNGVDLEVIDSKSKDGEMAKIISGFLGASSTAKDNFVYFIDYGFEIVLNGEYKTIPLEGIYSILEIVAGSIIEYSVKPDYVERIKDIPTLNVKEFIDESESPEVYPNVDAFIKAINYERGPSWFQEGGTKEEMEELMELNRRINEDKNDLTTIKTDSEDVIRELLDIILRNTTGQSKVVGNVFYDVNTYDKDEKNNLPVQEEIIGIYEFKPGGYVISYSVDGRVSFQTSDIGKKPLSFFTFNLKIADEITIQDFMVKTGHVYIKREDEREFDALLGLLYGYNENEYGESLNEAEEPKDDEVLLEPINMSDFSGRAKKVYSDSKWDVWQPTSEDGMIILSAGTRWLVPNVWSSDKKTGYDEIGDNSWALGQWNRAFVIISKSDQLKKYLFISGWGGMYSPSYSPYSLASWLIKQNEKGNVSDRMIKWFSDQNFQFVSTRLKTKVGDKLLDKAEGVYTYPDSGQVSWYKRKDIKKVIIKPGTTKILSNAFYNMPNLTEIEIPDSVTSIGNSVFKYCENLRKIKLSNNLSTIGEWAFSNTAITSMILPNTVKKISEGAFYGCKNLTTLFIPESVKTIPYSLFAAWSTDDIIKNLTVYCAAKEKPAGWDDAWADLVGGNETWNNTTNTWDRKRSDKQAKVIWGASKPNVSEGLNETNGEGEVQLDVTDVKNPLLFSDENWEVYFPTTYEIYKEFDNLFPQSDKYTEEEFYTKKPKYYYILNKNNNDKYIYSPNEKRGMWYGYVSDSNKWVIGAKDMSNTTETEKSLEDFLAEADSEGLLNWFSKKRPSLNSNAVRYKIDARKKVKAVVNNTTLIYPDNADLLQNHLVKKEIKKTITKVIIKEGVTSIEKGLFSGFEEVTDIEFPKSLKKIGSKAFEQCTGIKKLIFPENLVFIGSDAFKGTNLETVFIPKSVLFIGEDSLDGGFTTSTTFYCEATEQPEYWDSEWKNSSTSNKVIWGSSKSDLGESLTEENETVLGIADPKDEKNIIYSNDEFDIIEPISLSGLVLLLEEYRFITDTWDIETEIPNIYDTYNDINVEPLYYFIVDKVSNFVYLFLNNLINIGNGVKFLRNHPAIKWVNSTVVYESMDLETLRWFHNKFALDSEPIRSIEEAKELNYTFTYPGKLENYETNYYIEKIVIKDGTTKIEDTAFKDFTRINSIIIPDSVTTVGSYVFENCKRLTYVYIPSSVKKVGFFSFYRIGDINPSLVLIECGAESKPEGWSDTWTNKDFKVVWGVSKPSRTLKEKLELEEEDGVLLRTARDKQVFYEDDVWKVVKPITFEAFEELAEGTSWVKRTFGKWSNTIGKEEMESTFYDTKNTVFYFIINKQNKEESFLYSPKIFSKRNALTTKSDDTKYIYDILEKENITDGLLDWFQRKFSTHEFRIDAIKQMNAQLKELNYTVSYPSESFDKLMWDSRQKITKVIIKEGTEEIEEDAFNNFRSLKEINIPDSVKKIGERAFTRCDSIVSLKIPEGVERIEKKTFWGMNSLKEISLPNTITSIGYEAFWGCSGLKTIVLPSSLRTIDHAAFLGCHFKDVFIPISVTTIDLQGFDIRDSKDSTSPPTIRCEAPSKPAGWNTNWTNNDVKVIWGAKRSDVTITEDVNLLSVVPDIKTHYEDESWKIIKPQTTEAFTELAVGTDWVFVYNFDDEDFYTRTEKPEVLNILVNKKTGEKFIILKFKDIQGGGETYIKLIQEDGHRRELSYYTYVNSPYKGEKISKGAVKWMEDNILDY